MLLDPVSIRFEVRGGFRLAILLVGATIAATFQSALRFAVVSDGKTLIVACAGLAAVSIRFEVRGGFRRPRELSVEMAQSVSIRFEVRGGFRPGYCWCLGEPRKV